jgi:hypothetical protein
MAALVVSIAMGAIRPQPADALDGYYNCTLKPAYAWCDGRANGTYDGVHSWDYNEGWYPGTWDGSVTACQHLIRPSDGSVLGGSSCNANYAWANYGTNTCVCYDAEVMQISGGPHSINGHAVAN